MGLPSEIASDSLVYSSQALEGFICSQRAHVCFSEQ